jgi:hypothetical protein
MPGPVMPVCCRTKPDAAYCSTLQPTWTRCIIAAKARLPRQIGQRPTPSSTFRRARTACNVARGTAQSFSAFRALVSMVRI